MADEPTYAELPEEILTKLNTFTYGGFLLFYFDAQGEAHVESAFNEMVDAIALKKFALDILTSLDALNRRKLTAQLAVQQILDESDEDDEDGEDSAKEE